MDTDEIRYQVLEAIDQVQQQFPSNFVNDVQVVEIAHLDLRDVRDEMDLLEADGYTQEANSQSGRSTQLNAQGRRLLRELRAQREHPPQNRDELPTADRPIYAQHGWQPRDVINVAGSMYIDSAQSRPGLSGIVAADVWFEPSSEVGATIGIKLKNWNDRDERIDVFVYLQSGEQVIRCRSNWSPLETALIKARSSEEVTVPLTQPRRQYLSKRVVVGRAYPYQRPSVERIEVQDALEQKITVSEQLIVRLNDQILDQWPLSDDDD